MKNLTSIFLIISIFIIAYSCASTQNISGKNFKANTKRRTAQLRFDNDTICRFINIFHCKDINSEFKEITITCRYTKIDDIIILKNMECKSDSCVYEYMIKIPTQNSKKCSFLNEKNRKGPSGIVIGPNYMTDYERYGFIPNIDIDTLYIAKNKLIMIKEDPSKSKTIGFIFK